MIRFLGSIRFALILIALSLLAVAAATFLEAKTESHGWAEEWIYKSPFFHLLLFGYFVNILVSALLRWPFQARHIPFLITHLGLLMVIGGVFIKSIFGVQGHLQLIEGTASDELVLPNIPALHITRRDSQASIPWNRFIAPHAEEKWAGWIHNQALILKGHLPISVTGSPFQIHVGMEEPLNIYFAPAPDLEDPYLLVEQSEEGMTLSSRSFSKTFSPKRIDEWIAYDKGFSGYSLQAKIPFITKNDLIESIANDLRAAPPPLSPPLELLRVSSEKAGVDFAKATVKYLKRWNEEGGWLYEVPFPAPIDWKGLPESSQNALFWIATLFDEENFMEKIREHQWPFMEPLETIEASSLPDQKKRALQYTTWMIQLFALCHELPLRAPSLSPSLSAKMLSAYLRLYEIHWSSIPEADLRGHQRFITLESPLYRSIETKTPPIKKEEANPLALIDFEGESVPLVYDPTSTRLKIPTKSALLRLQPHRIALPYHVRLHSAEEIKYPGSEQTASYGCTLSLQSKSTQATIPCRLSMNHVFETDDGYRFYLSGMGPVDSLGVRSVQLVVNRDPAKWILTYPGAGLVSLGIVLLFWFPRQKKKLY